MQAEPVPVLATIILATLMLVPSFAQNTLATPDELYKRCDTAIKTSPDQALGPCKQFLDVALPHDVRRIQHVKAWIAGYANIQPFVQYLQGLSSDNAAPFVYLPDMNLDLPQTSDTEGQFKIHIARSFGTANEEAMLRKAEAVYPSPATMVENVYGNLFYWGKNIPHPMMPIWGMSGNDNIFMTNVVTASAVRYYYDLTQSKRANPRLPTGFTAVESSMKYDASIKHFDDYSHKGTEFKNVYVADMTLEWSFTCGGLCGVGFTRNKVVVLDEQGSIVSMYLDAPVNSMSWVS